MYSRGCALIDSAAKPCASYTPSEGLKTAYLPQGEFEINSGAKKYYLTDHLGTVQEVVTDNGTSLWHGEYSAYGQLMHSTGTAAPQFGYAGMMRHGLTGNYLTRFRVYNPEKARWLSTDPIGFAGGRNLYGYVGGSPINYYDQNGLSKFDALFGYPKKFWNWYHRRVKKEGDPDLTKEEAKELFEEWRRIDKPGPDNKQRGFVEEGVLDWLVPWYLLPSPLACGDINCHPEFTYKKKSSVSQCKKIIIISK